MKKLLLPLLAFAALALPARAAISNLEAIKPDGFSRGAVLTVTNYTGTAELENFPVLVRISEGGISGFHYSDMMFSSSDLQNSARDIAFVDENGTPLAYDIDTWNPTGTSLVWVTIPSLENNTEFAMFYRSSKSGKEVCDGNAFTNYVGVWHLNETAYGTSASITDSTTNDLNGLSGPEGDTKDGVVGTSRRITSTENQKSDTAIKINNSSAALSALDSLGTNFVVSFWMRPVGTISNQKNKGVRYNALIGRKAKTDDRAWHLQLADTSTNMRIWGNDATDQTMPTTTAGTIPLVQHQWTKIDVIYAYGNATYPKTGNKDVSNYVLYTNGAESVKGDFGYKQVTGTGILYIGGGFAGGERTFYGDMDEVRVGSFTPSADWMKASYEQEKADAFLGYGAVQTFAEAANPVASLELADSGAAFAQFSGSISICGGTSTVCRVLAKVWPDGATETNFWTEIADGLAANDTFAASLVGLLPNTPYRFKIKAVNNLPEPLDSTVVEGAFTTSGAGEIGSGGDAKRDGDSMVHTFTIARDGTDTFEFVPPSYATSVEALVVAGGGPGGYNGGGGGGAGGLLHYDAFPVTGGATYQVTVGAGGIASASSTQYGENGGDSFVTLAGGSIINNAHAFGGGAGGNGAVSGNDAYRAGVDGGSGGGGASYKDNLAGSGRTGQGNDGGLGSMDSKKSVSGGGGGASAAGGSLSLGSMISGGGGGDGIQYSISGTLASYAGGGGGGGDKSGGGTGGGGGLGGGGSGGMENTDVPGSEYASNGENGKGGGGGGGSTKSGCQQGGNGGNGVVIFRYDVQGTGQGMVEPAVAFESLSRVDDPDDPNHGLTTVGYRVAWAGDGYDYADVLVIWGFRKGSLDHTNALSSATGVIGRGTGTFMLPDQDRTVYLRVLATNAAASALSPKIETIPFVNPNAPEATVSVTATEQHTATFAANVTGLGEGATSVQGVFQVCGDEDFEEGTYLTFPASGTISTVPGTLTGSASGLTFNTAYFVRASLTNNIAEYFETDPVEFRTKVPGAPSGHVVTNDSSRPVQVGTTTITATGYLHSPGTGATTATIRLEASTDNFETFLSSDSVENQGTQWYAPLTISGLESETEYFLRLRMENEGHMVQRSTIVGPFTTLPPPVNLTIPDLASYHVTLVSVTTNDVAVAGNASVYTVNSNDTVVATFAAADGYRLVGGATVTVVMDGDKTLTGVPTAELIPSPTVTVTLTVSEPPANVSLVSVTTNDVAVAGNARVYTVFSNATATVTFAAAEGYRLVGSATVSVVMDGNKTLATADMPTAAPILAPTVIQSATKVYAGKTVTLTASAAGATSYYWLKNGAQIEGGENGTLTVAWRKPQNDPRDTYQAVAVYSIDELPVDSGASTALTVENLPMGTVISVLGRAPTPPAPHDYGADYLTFRVLSSGTICWKAFGSLTKTIEYRINDGEWTSLTSTADGATIPVVKDDLVRFRGSNTAYATSKSNYSGFEGGSATYDIEGNIMSLLYGDDFAESTAFPNGSTYTFCSLFKKAPVISAEHLILPATTLKNYCYRALFSYCTTLTKAPELPATTLAQGCYWYMFEQCGITEAPVLNATTLVNECYGHMFEGCGLLNRITCLATSGFGSSKCLEGWVTNVAGEGAFVKAANVTSWAIDSVNGIPPGWIVCEDVLLLPPEVAFYGDEIELACDTEGAEIHYRLGQTGAFALYTQPISIVADTVVEAYSTYQGHTSPTVTQTCVYVHETPLQRSNKDLTTWRYGGNTVTTPYSVNRIDGHSSSYAKGTFSFETSVTLKAVQPTYLWFQHADQSADIYVDDVKVGTHWGGYNAFFFDISEYVHRGQNDIRVALCNTTRSSLAPAAGDFNFNATLGNVKLFTSPVLPAMEYGYDGFHITSTVSVSSATTNATIYVETKVPAGADLKCIVSDASYAWTNTVESTGSKQTFSTTISNAHLWNGTLDPHLYTVTLEIRKDGDLYHKYERPYGFRYYSYVINETVNGQSYTGFLLNGQPYQLRGVCMHDDVEGKANALTDSDYDQEFAIIEELGCNFIRLAHYPHPKEVYDRCDRLGIIVQTEVPCVNKLQTSMPDDYYTHLTTQYTDMVQQHFNHPCIVFWGLSNETTTENTDEAKNFAKEKIEGYYDLIKKMDSERMVGYVMSHNVDNPSAYYNDPDVDWLGCNLYVGWYIDQNSNNPSTRLNTRLANTLTRLGKPLALSEYGCGGTQHCHSEDFMSTTTRGNKARHDIEYQMWLHEGHIAAIRNYPQLLFTGQWQLFDIAVYNRNEGFTECLDGVNVSTNDVLRRLNNKGLVERDHITKKDTFYIYKAEWNSEDKFVHICGKDYTKTTDRKLKCYTNDGDTLSLYVNGMPVETKPVVDHIAEFTARTFSSGDVIRVEGDATSDTMTFR